MHELCLEQRLQANRSGQIGGVMLPPPPDADYWVYRVRVSDEQAVLGFPKYSRSLAVGFAHEEDWNTNLPHWMDAHDILEHIGDNRGSASISDATILAAIRLIQDAARRDGWHEPPEEGKS
jgi:hypothetical protein